MLSKSIVETTHYQWLCPLCGKNYMEGIAISVWPWNKTGNRVAALKCSKSEQLAIHLSSLSIHFKEFPDFFCYVYVFILSQSDCWEIERHLFLDWWLHFRDSRSNPDGYLTQFHHLEFTISNLPDQRWLARLYRALLDYLPLPWCLHYHHDHAATRLTGSTHAALYWGDADHRCVDRHDYQQLALLVIQHLQLHYFIPIRGWIKNWWVTLRILATCKEG